MSDLLPCPVCKAHVELTRLCEARWLGPEAWAKAWHWAIPANPVEDTDLILSAGMGVAHTCVGKRPADTRQAAPVEARGEGEA